MADNQKKDTKQEKKQKKAQSIPLFTPIVKFTLKYFTIFSSAGLICLFFYYCLFAYDIYHGNDRLDRVITGYEVTYDSINGLEGWLDIQSIYTNSILWVQERFEASINSGDSSVSGYLTNLLRNSYNYYNDALVYGDSLRSETSTFISQVLAIWLLVSLTWFMKMMILTSYIPLYFLLSWAAAVNGMAERKIRMYRGDLDSSDRLEFYYRKFRIASLTVIYFYFVVPISIDPAFIFLPSAATTAFVVRHLAKNYKLYW